MLGEGARQAAADNSPTTLPAWPFEAAAPPSEPSSVGALAQGTNLTSGPDRAKRRPGWDPLGKNEAERGQSVNLLSVLPLAVVMVAGPQIIAAIFL
ncbi:MAG TPA: hypothetical protein VHI50_02300, partial [Micromonosporaceae bacterium]|nr:hypothetical protein [Micromonosporaceae bacterium]